LDDVVNFRDLEQVTGPLGGAGVAVSGLYCSSLTVTATGYVGMGEVILFNVERYRQAPYLVRNIVGHPGWFPQKQKNILRFGRTIDWENAFLHITDNVSTLFFCRGTFYRKLYFIIC
jgi:hypothetical protein